MAGVRRDEEGLKVHFDGGLYLEGSVGRVIVTEEISTLARVRLGSRESGNES